MMVLMRDDGWVVGDGDCNDDEDDGRNDDEDDDNRIGRLGVIGVTAGEGITRGLIFTRTNRSTRAIRATDMKNIKNPGYSPCHTEDTR